MAEPRILVCGDCAISVEFGDCVDKALNQRVIALDLALAECAIAGVLETVPTYRSLMVHVDPVLVDFAHLKQTLLELSKRPPGHLKSGRRWRVPVVYGGEFGVDLGDVAAFCDMSPDEIIEAHSAPVYTVFMIGFMPGYSYLGGLDERIAIPRLSQPRMAVPSCSIAIGGAQTSVGSVEAPSGWRLIGRTPVHCFHLTREPVFLFEPGDEIVFEPISSDRFDDLFAASSAGEMIATLDVS